MKTLAGIGTLAAVLLVLQGPGWSRPVPRASEQPETSIDALGRDIRALQDGQAQLKKDLENVKAILRSVQAARTPAARHLPVEPAPAGLVIDIGNAPFKGDSRAKVVLIDFNDFQCPFCVRHVRETMTVLEKEHIGPGKLKYVMREFPLESIHPFAFKASEAALCAGDQGKYFEFHDLLFANQKALSPGDLGKHAQTLGLDTDRFSQCLEAGTFGGRVRADLAEGRRTGIRATPSFLLGVQEGSVVNVKFIIRGAYPYATFKEAIEKLQNPL